MQWNEVVIRLALFSHLHFAHSQQMTLAALTRRVQVGPPAEELKRGRLAGNVSGESFVNSYEVISLNASGREARRQELQCRDHEDAVDRASAMRSPHGVEVWCEGALIWHWDPSAFADDGKLSGETNIGEVNCRFSSTLLAPARR